MVNSYDFNRVAMTEDRQEETFRRLHCLIGKGYVADLGTPGSSRNAIFLTHLGRGPTLILYPDGVIAAASDAVTINPQCRDDASRIFNDNKVDDEAFDRLLARIRQPTWRERTRPDRDKYIWTPTFHVAFWVAAWAMAELIEAIWP